MKTFIEYLIESEAATNVDGPAVATTPQPTFLTSRWGGKAEIKVPHKTYTQVWKGKDRGERWGVDDPAAQKAIQGALYKEGQVLVTSDMTGGSVLLHHKKIQRMKADQDFTISEETVKVIGVSKLLAEDEVGPEILDINWTDDDGDLDDRGAQADIYTPAHDFAQMQYGYTEEQAQFFAKVVLRVAHLWDRTEGEVELVSVTSAITSILAGQTIVDLELDSVVANVVEYIQVKNILFKESTEMKTFSEFLAESALSPMPSNNTSGGYHGHVKGENEADRAKKYEARFKDVASHVKHIPGVTSEHVRNYLDSAHGRHAADTASHAEHIKQHYSKSGKAGFEKDFHEIQRQTKAGHFPNEE